MTHHTYESLSASILDASGGVPRTDRWHSIGYNTTARLAGDEDDVPTVIVIEYRGKVVARMHEDRSITVMRGGLHTTTVQRRLNSILKPIGSVVTIHGVEWQVLDIASGTRRDFRDGMTIQPNLTVSTTTRQENRA